MASQVIQYMEEMVGAGHPTKADTLNRALLVEHNDDGTHKSAFGLSHLQQLINNLSLTATVGSKSLTIAVKGADGDNCSASNIATIAFRSATLTDGKPVFRTVTGALSVVLSPGSTLDFGPAEAGRIYVWAIDNAGTVELALSRTADLFPESNLVSTTAEGGAGAADSAAVMYSTTARSNVACRCIGYVEITTGATAGEWDNAATKIQVMGPGVKRTGEIVQDVWQTTQSGVDASTAFPNDGTIPQITEGDQAFARTVTATSALNPLIVESVCHLSHGAGSTNCGIALFRDAVANALATGGNDTPGTSRLMMFKLNHVMIAGTVSAIAFQVRFGGGGGTARLNYQDGGTGYGNKNTSYLRITEVMA
jgi:hypothetical protein